LGARLFAALAATALVTAGAAWRVSAQVGPGLFRLHLGRAGLGDNPAAMAHAEEAFRSAGATAVGVAAGVAAALALALSWWLSRRLARPLRELSAAAAEVAAGRFTAVPDPGLGREFDQLTAAFNAMADSLARSVALRTRLLNDVAHELRTPVAAIAAGLDAIEDGVLELSPATLAVIRAQGDRLTRLSQDLAAVARAESPELSLRLRPVDALARARAAAAAAGDRFRDKGLSLTVAAPGPAAGALMVLADADRMGQVLGNLLDNAWRHTPAGGAVRVTVEGRRGSVRLSVSDTGEGIAAPHLPHLFERFYRADTARDRQHGGSGIGLAIARALVEAQGGAIQASSDGSGRGARFDIALPRLAPPS
jgi:signal transduction histidine kinase